MLFLQGTRDALADVHLIEKLGQQLGPRAALKLLTDANHSFHVPARSGRKDADVRLRSAGCVGDLDRNRGLECLKMHIERPSETHGRVVPVALWAGILSGIPKRF